MISTLRDELSQRHQEIIELEAALSSVNQQVTMSKFPQDMLEVECLCSVVWLC